MKKFFLIFATIFIVMSCTAFAADFSRTIGVVIVGGAEFKTPDSYKLIKNEFAKNINANFDIGKDIQNKYQKFLLNRDLIGNVTPRRQDLIDFTAMSGRGKILFMVISDENIDHQNNAKRRQKNRITVQVDGYLCDTENIIDTATTSQEAKSKTSDLRARQEAFKKCIKDLSQSLSF